MFYLFTKLLRSLQFADGTNPFLSWQDSNLLQMEGLWYEIARTRFTFNKMESVISYHRYDPVDNAIKSFYTGTTYV